MNLKLKILIVDDTRLVVSRLVNLLQEMEDEAELLEANSYETALEVIKANTPDILLLDIKMPGRNGIELLANLRDAYPGIIVIMFTNMVSDFYKDQCKEMGAKYFVDKSSEFEKIPGIIKSLLPVKRF